MGERVFEPRYWPRAMACCGLSPRVINAASRCMGQASKKVAAPGTDEALLYERRRVLILIWLRKTATTVGLGCLASSGRFKRAPLSFKTFPGFFHTISILRRIWVDDTGLVGMIVITESTAVRGMAKEDT